MKKTPLWPLFNLYGWLIFAMSVITAFIIRAWWIALFGVIGYQMVLLVEMMWGGNLGRTGRVRLAKAEQENRELRDERARLVGTIREQEGKLAGAAKRKEPEQPKGTAEG